jgi:acetyl-CoA acetyltransferase
MRDALIVATARTPIGRAYRGAFNATPAPTLAAHAIRAAVDRAGIDPAMIEDCIYGMSGSRMVGHALVEGKRRGARYAVVTMCVGGGMGAAGLFEVI